MSFLSRLFGRAPQAAQPVQRAVSPQASGNPPDKHYDQIPIASLQNWAVPTIQAACMGHVNGNFQEGAKLSESLIADDRVQGALNGRVKGVTRRHARMEPSESDRDGKVADEVQRVWPKVFTKPVLEQLMFWTVFSGFALFHVRWYSTGTGKGQRWMPRLEVWNLRYCYFDQASMRYVAITMEDSVVYVEVNDPSWFLYTPYGYYRGWIRGAIRSVSIAWVVRAFALRDWSRFCEVHGLPTRIVKVPQMGNEADKQRFFNKIRNLGAETTILVPQQAGADGKDWAAELLEAKDTSWKAFPGIIEQCNDTITLTIRGTNLTTSVKTGTGAATEAHAEEDSDYADADAEKICQAADEWLWRWYCAYNFGDPSLCPESHLDQPADTKLKDESQGLKMLAEAVTAFKAAGMPVDVQALAERWDVPLLAPEDVEAEEVADPEEETLDPDDPGDMGETLPEQDV